MEDEITVIWQDRKIRLFLYDTLSEFLNYLTKRFENLPASFEISYMENDKKIIITTEEEYNTACKLKDLIITIEDKYMIEMPLNNKSIKDHLDYERKNTKLKVIWEENPKYLINDYKVIKNNNDNMKPCIACNGTCLSKKKRPCKKCNGTGKINGFLYEYVQPYILRSSKVDLAKSQAQSILSNSIYIADNISCSLCKKTLEPGDAIFLCDVCNVKLCSDCETINKDQHGLLEKRYQNNCKDYLSEVISDESENNPVIPGETICKIWTIKNVGLKGWPKETNLVLKGNENVKFRIGELLPGMHSNVFLKLQAPKEIGVHLYKFGLRANKKEFGNYLEATINVIDPKLCIVAVYK